MRITSEHKDAIRQVIREEAGKKARVRVFGSRLDENRLGGDIDLLVELDEPVANPAHLSACIAGRLMRILHGRNVDVVIAAPNLNRLPIHVAAEREGRLL